MFFFDRWGILLILGQCWNLLVSKPCFLSFSTQNHAESFRNFVKNAVWDLKRAKLNQKSEIWAHMGPARALKSGKSSGKTHMFFVVFIFLWTNVVFGLQTMFFMVLTCSWVFLPKNENDTERIWNYLEKQFWIRNVWNLIKSLVYVSWISGFPPKIPPSFTEHLEEFVQACFG